MKNEKKISHSKRCRFHGGVLRQQNCEMIVSQRCRNRSISARTPRGLKKNDHEAKPSESVFQPEVSAEIDLLRHRFETFLSLFSTENEVEYALSAEKTSFHHAVK